MATPRRQSSLKPHLNQIREWVAEGATDLWIGHKLETTPSAVARFRRQQGILRDRAGRKSSVDAPVGTDELAPTASPEPTDPPEGDADSPSDAAPVETSPAEARDSDPSTGDEPAEKPAARPRKRQSRSKVEEPAAEPVTTEPVTAEAEAFAAADSEAVDEQTPREGDAEPGDGDEPRSRRRGRRGGRGRRRENGEAEETGDRVGGEARPSASGPLELEGVFDQGGEGYGLWLDAAVRDAEIYRTHWQGARELVVTVTADQIVLRRA